MPKVNQYLDELSKALRETQVTDAQGKALSLQQGVDRAVDFISKLKAKGTSKIMLIGNGGSAAIVSHMQNDLCDCVGVKAIVFNEAAFLTAIANDHGYETFFEEAVKLWAQSGDLLIAVSSSGRSKNILRAVKAARERSAAVFTFSGFLPDNPLRQAGDLNFYIASEKYGCVETSHATLGHLITDAAMTACRAPSLTSPGS